MSGPIVHLVIVPVMVAVCEAFCFAVAPPTLPSSTLP
jgi:hypothetical protein